MNLKHWLFLLCFIFPNLSWGIKTVVTLESGGTEEFRNKTETILTDILNECNKYYEIGAPLEDLRSYFIPLAFNEFKDLVNNTKLYAIQRGYKSHLLQTDAGYYEVRDIKVRVFMGKTEGQPYQYLVFVLKEDGSIVSVHFALEKHQYREIIQSGKAVKDLANREKILDFLELYRTAYNKKDLDFIEKALSDDALIIVGYVILLEKSEIDYYQRSHLSPDKIQLVKLSKADYLHRLKEVFQMNDFVKVDFDQIEIERHPLYEKIYGVQVKQHWNSSTYSDEGYLFLMIDFIDPNAPIIHVRAWQPHRFEDGSVISIYDFEIVEANGNY